MQHTFAHWNRGHACTTDRYSEFPRKNTEEGKAEQARRMCCSVDHKRGKTS